MFTVRIAQTEFEKSQIYRLRYTVMIEERKREFSCADHERRIMTDDMDKNAFNIGAWCGERLAGCVRLNIYSDPYAAAYIDRFEPRRIISDLNACCTGTKLIIDPVFRHTRLNVLLQQAVLNMALANGLLVCFVQCVEELVPYYRKFGFRTYMPGSLFMDGRTMVPTVFDVRSMDQTKVSPLQYNLDLPKRNCNEGLGRRAV